MSNGNVMERVTDSVAATALTVPLWIVNVHDIFVQLVVPGLGATWLFVQIYFKLKNERNKK